MSCRRKWISAVFATHLICSALTASVNANESPKLAFSVILATTSDYVYRGVSLNNEQPSPFVYVEANYGILYAATCLIETYVGEDALGREIGNLEFDATVGVMPTFGPLTFNVGVKFVGYPDGRDLLPGSLVEAERDFFEPFVGVTLALNDQFSLTGTGYWTPQYYGETGSVKTFESTAAIKLPDWHSVTSKLTATFGHARSENPDIVAPGHSYSYYNVGVESRIEKIIVDVRYWHTDVDGLDLFEHRIAVGMGVMLN